MLIGLGHDLQSLQEFEQSQSLRDPNFFFTPEELAYCQQKQHPLSSLAGLFAAKESLYKALPTPEQFFWTDAVIIHNQQGAPSFDFRGELLQRFQKYGWTSHLSISHSGNYASAVVTLSLLSSNSSMESVL